MASIHDLCNPEPEDNNSSSQPVLDHPPHHPQQHHYQQHPGQYHQGPPHPSQHYPPGHYSEYDQPPPPRHSSSHPHDRDRKRDLSRDRDRERERERERERHPQHYQPYPPPPHHQHPQHPHHPQGYPPRSSHAGAPPPPYHYPPQGEQLPYDARHEGRHGSRHGGHGYDSPYPPNGNGSGSGSRSRPSPPPPHGYDHYAAGGNHPHQAPPPRPYQEHGRDHSRDHSRGERISSSRGQAPPSGPVSNSAYPPEQHQHHRSIKTENQDVAGGPVAVPAGQASSASASAARRVSAHPDERPVKIKIVQQPLHARMCGFGEKDRRPVDPPPIVQLLLDEDHEQHPSKRMQRSAAAAAAAVAKKVASVNAAAAAAAAAAATKSGKSKRKSREDDDGRGHEADEETHPGDNEEEDETYQLDDEDEDEQHGPGSGSRPRRSSVRTGGTRGTGTVKQEDGSHAESTPALGKRVRPSTGPGGSRKAKRSDDDGDSRSDRSHSGSEGEDNDEVDDHDDHDGQLQEQDPLFVLHVSLWSADGTEVRNMIATPGQSEPPKLTRILMGSLVVSPILLNNPEGVPGWYFSFPDLSIRTEGVYTLKFSLMRFGSFDFMNSEDGHASTLVAEEISDPFTVFSAKKFPGMTESTELSKAFAKQGLKIPIRNDLRARKVDRD